MARPRCRVRSTCGRCIDSTTADAAKGRAKTVCESVTSELHARTLPTLSAIMRGFLVPDHLDVRSTFGAWLVGGAPRRRGRHLVRALPRWPGSRGASPWRVVPNRHDPKL